MRRMLTVAGCLFLMLPVLPSSVHAQEQEEKGELGYVAWVEIAPAHRDAYREAVEMLVEASGAAAVPYQFHFWSGDTGFVLYYPVENMAYFDDPMQFWSRFEGTPGEAMRDEFLTAMRKIPMRSTSEIVETLPSAVYWPEGFSGEDWSVGHMHFEWLNPGQEDAWMKLAGDFVAFLETIDYPFGVQAIRTMIGEERMAWVFYVPSLSDFHADATWDDLIEAAGAEAEWEAISDRFPGIVARWTHKDYRYVESMSYVPEM